MRDYIAICPVCSRCVGWIAGDLERKEIGKQLACWAKLGLSIERATTEYAKALPFGHLPECPSNWRNWKAKSKKAVAEKTP